MLWTLKWKAAHPQVTHKRLSGRDCVSEGRDMGEVWVDKTTIVLQCRKWCRSGKHRGGCGNTTEESTHMASVLCSYTQPSPTLLSQGLIHSSPHLSHLWIPQVLINTTHFQSNSSWCHFLYCCGLNFFYYFLYMLAAFLHWFTGSEETD